MLFNTYQFILFFLPLTLILYYFINIKLPNLSYLFIFFSSIVFYSTWDFYFLFLIFGSIILNFKIGILVKKRKKIYLFLGILFQILILSYFKYKNFFLENFNFILNGKFQIELLILPLGISFLLLSIFCI